MCSHSWSETNRKKMADGRWMIFYRCSKCGETKVGYG